MRAKFIGEHKDFKRRQDPIRSMGIGMITWDDIQDGTILYSKIPFAISAASDKLSSTYVISKIPQQPANIYFGVDNLEIKQQGIIRMILTPCNTLKKALEFREKVLAGEYITPEFCFYLWGYEDQFSHYFDIVQKSQLE